MEITPVTGKLSCGVPYSIHESRKKAPGVIEGFHFIAVLQREDGSGDETAIPDLPPEVFAELTFTAHLFAINNAPETGRYRVAFNGPEVGRRKHAHIHIIFPCGDDDLPTLVATS